jgi:integrase/recombinase XerD
LELTFVVIDNQLDYYTDLFLSVKRASCRPATAMWYDNALKRYREATGDKAAWPPTLEHCLIFFEALRERELSAATKNNYYRALNGFFNWLKKSNAIETNPLDLFGTVKAPHPLPLAPPLPIIKRLFTAVKNSLEETDNWRYVRDLALFSVAFDTGARIGEIERMTVDDVDLLASTIWIYATKVNQGRTLVLGDETTVIIARWISERVKIGVSRKLRSLFVSDYQMQGFRGFTAGGMRERLQYWQDLAGVDRFRFNGFRHAYAVYSIRNGAELLDVQGQMGHTNIKTTAVYTLVVPEGRSGRHKLTSPVRRLGLR